MILFNYLSDDGIQRLTQYKVEVLPNAFVNVNPNYEYSPAQKRLIIDDELIVLDEDNPMEEIKNYTKKRRLSDKSKKKKSSSVFKLPSFLKK